MGKLDELMRLVEQIPLIGRLIQESVDRSRRTEAKVTAIMQWLGLKHLMETRKLGHDVLIDTHNLTVVVANPSVTVGEIVTELRIRELTGNYAVVVCGNYWGEVHV